MAIYKQPVGALYITGSAEVGAIQYSALEYTESISLSSVLQDASNRGFSAYGSLSLTTDILYSQLEEAWTYGPMPLDRIFFASAEDRTVEIPKED